MINGTLNRTTNLLVLLIVTSFILPATEIMYASGFTENNTAPPSGFTENNAAPPSGFRLSNNTGNAYCDSCNNDIYNGSGDLKDMVLAVQNRERAAVGVPPLVWSDKLAADAKPYAEHLLTTAELEHPSQEWVDTHPNSLPGYEGENLAWRGNTTTVPMAQMQQGWISEKNDYHGQLISNDWSPGDPLIGHYTQMVWNTTTQVGCATSSGGPYGRDVLDCRYSPVGNIVGQKPY
ncbi:MAG: CAP domain-containing protein [Nitrososphaeraceae archaeon]